MSILLKEAISLYQLFMKIHRIKHLKGIRFIVAIALLAMAIITVALVNVAEAAPIAPTAADPTTMPYDEIQAESAAHNGIIIDARNKRTYPGLANEAIERRAVTLNAVGEYVEFTVPRSANSIVVRYAIPDSADGKGLTAPIGLYINGVKQPDLIFTSKYAWIYGTYPFNNNPGDIRPHHYYDEVNRLTPQMSAGTKVRLQVESNSTAPWFTIDLINFEQVAPASTIPAGYLSLTTDFGADPSGIKDSTTAFQNALYASSSQGRGLWIPSGEYKVSTWLQVRDNVTLKGAGIWYSKIHFVAQTGNNAGLMGPWNTGTSAQNVHFSDFAIWGEVVQRVDNDQINGIGGAYSNSTFINLWIEHTKCGMWLDGPFDRLMISNVRIRNQNADGINFHKQVTNSTVTQSFFRNTGDDAIAMWNDGGGGFNTFSFNRIEMPVLANAIAIYGGESNIVTDNYVADQQAEGGGIHLGNRFPGSRPISGTTVIARNVIVRAGSQDDYNNWNYGTGALWFYALDANMTGTIRVEDNQIIDSNYEAIHFIGSSVTNVTLNHNQIIGAGTYAMEIRSAGAVTISNTTATDLGHGSILNCRKDFAITDGGGNGNLITQTPVCPEPYPAPIYEH
ncbi:MAG: glycosyl hydrolase family 28-related protein [Rhizonema sp. PD38]|nr:glycosyl hydrolase family 28-related protein [Rhizonema sp. PD38]